MFSRCSSWAHLQREPIPATTWCSLSSFKMTTGSLECGIVLPIHLCSPPEARHGERTWKRVGSLELQRTVSPGKHTSTLDSSSHLPLSKHAKPRGYWQQECQTTKSLWESMVFMRKPRTCGAVRTNKEWKASHPGRERRRSRAERCLAVISTNHWHNQDRSQPLDKSTRNESEQCTLMRERKFQFIYLLFMSCSFGSICNRKGKAILELARGTSSCVGLWLDANTHTHTLGTAPADHTTSSLAHPQGERESCVLPCWGQRPIHQHRVRRLRA